MVDKKILLATTLYNIVDLSQVVVVVLLSDRDLVVGKEINGPQRLRKMFEANLRASAATYYLVY